MQGFSQLATMQNVSPRHNLGPYLTGIDVTIQKVKKVKLNKHEMI